jgi:hypothetical protein
LLKARIGLVKAVAARYTLGKFESPIPTTRDLNEIRKIVSEGLSSLERDGSLATARSESSGDGSNVT